MIFFREIHNICPLRGDILYSDNGKLPSFDDNKRILGTYYLRHGEFSVSLPDGNKVFTHNTKLDTYFGDDDEKNYCFQQGVVELLKHYPDIEG